MNESDVSIPPLLTDAQKNELAENNMRLVWHVAHKFRSTGLDLEELYSAALMGMSIALARFDPSRNIRFSTYAALCMETQVLMVLRKERKRKRYMTVSFEDRVSSASDTTFADVLKTNDNTEDIVVSRQAVHEALGLLTNREKEMLLLDVSGYRQVDIADRYGVTQSLVSRIVKAARQKIQNFYYEGVV